MLLVVLGGFGTAAQELKLDWRRIGNTALDLSLASVATGPVDRVWYSADGSTLFALASSGRVFATTDFEAWTEAPAGTAPPAALEGTATRVPEPAVRVRAAGSSPRVYAVGRAAYRSDDSGATWANLTQYRNVSLLGDGLADLAVSPRDADEISVAAGSGVWRSLDGGLSWTGLNAELPNLRTARILGVPSGVSGTRIAVRGGTGIGAAWEWSPGEKQAWRESDGRDLLADSDLRQALGVSLRARLTAVAIAGDYVYAGSADGQLWSSSDRGRTWTRSPDTFAFAIERIWVDAREPRLALAALGVPVPDAPPNAKPGRVLRTINGGAFWDDLSSNLPDGAAVHGVSGDRGTGAVYAATDRGLYLSYGSLVNAGPATPWTRIAAGLPDAPATDVALDGAGNQVYVALDGYGVFAAPAPHRFRDPRVVSAADFAARAAAPGALLSVIGANLTAVRAGAVNLPILAAGDGKTEIQVPFNIAGTTIPLSFDAGNGPASIPLALRPASPAIFVDRDGSPMLLDGDSGVLLDARTPARSNGRLQILATGLGRVRPDWPAGTPAPVENSPAVIAPVKVFLDREPVAVTRAILAPGYIGFYLIEVELPKIVNLGPAELYVEADGQASNRVRVYLEP